MPEFIHNRAEHILAKNPSMPKSEAFAIATQQGHALGKNPKDYGTAKGKRVAKAKFDTPKDDVKAANPGGLESPKMEKKSFVEVMHAAFLDELQKIGFNELDASKLLKAVKPNVLRRGTSEIMGMGYAGMPPLSTAKKGVGAMSSTFPQLKEQFEGQLHAPGLEEFLGAQPHIFTPNRGDSTQFFRNAVDRPGLDPSEAAPLKAALQSIQPQNRKMLDAVMKGHEQAETQVDQHLGVHQFGHRSPDVLLREHNMVATLPPEQAPVGNVMRNLRGLPGGEADALKPYGVTYGTGRLSRHARKHIVNDMHDDAVRGIKQELGEKTGFATNEFSGPMNPYIPMGNSRIGAPKQHIAQVDPGGVGISGTGSEPTRGGFLLASKQASAEGKRTAKAKFDTPKDDVKAANPGGLTSSKMEKKSFVEVMQAAFLDELESIKDAGVLDSVKKVLTTPIPGTPEIFPHAAVEAATRFAKKGPAVAAEAVKKAPQDWRAARAAAWKAPNLQPAST